MPVMSFPARHVGTTACRNKRTVVIADLLPLLTDDGVTAASLAERWNARASILNGGTHRVPVEKQLAAKDALIVLLDAHALVWCDDHGFWRRRRTA